MQAGELWWRGKEDQFSSKLDLMAPPCLSLEEAGKASVQKSSSGLVNFTFNGKGFQTEQSDAVLVAYSQWKLTMESMIAATESTVRAQAAIDSLRKMLVDFRGSLKNDLTSMKAASERVQNEVCQMQEKYRQAQSLLITPEFEKAIANAERMATALESIQKLTETKISVAVFSGGKHEDKPV